MLTLISIELYKIFKKWRTYIGFITIGAVVAVVHIAMIVEGKDYYNFVTRSLRENFIVVGNFLNGYVIAYLVLGSLAVHIPFLITLVTGDLLAGEATAGTYRLVVTRPVSRISFLFAKFVAGLIYSASVIAFLAAVSLGVGLLIFGTGELIVAKRMIIIFERSDVLWRFAWAYGYATLSMGVVASLSMMFSSLVENAIGPIVSTMAVVICFLILSALDIDFINAVKPFLFTTYINDWMNFFGDPVDFAEIARSSLVLVLHIFLFFGITLLIFRKKDILS